MRVEKITDKYTLTEVNGVFIVDYGTISRLEDNSTTLRFYDVDPKTFNLEHKCGCTTSAKSQINSTTVEATIKLDIRGVFEKTTIIENNKEKRRLILKGNII